MATDRYPICIRIWCPRQTWFGWPTDPDIENLRDDFARVFEMGTYAPFSECVHPPDCRRNVTGWIIGPGNVYWNVKKNGD